MATTWTLERRARQAELIRQWRLWAKSTGPRSPDSKERVSRNAWTGGLRAQLCELANAELGASRELVSRYR